MLWAKSNYEQVEHAFKMFFTGEKNSIGQFSRDNMESLVADYIQNTSRLSDQRWNQIMDHCGLDNEGSSDLVEVSVPCLDKGRRTLYIPSSPTAINQSD